MTHGGQSLLSVRGLVVRYPSGKKGRTLLTAVRGIDLEIAPAGIYGLVGESGSGKSSLARAILQLEPLVTGQVLFHGQDLAAMKKSQLNATRRTIQAVFQDSLASLSPRRTILQTLVEPLDHFRIGTSSGRRDKAAAAIETVGLDATVMQRYPQELSGGQRQRVSLARALVTEPELIIADEPVSSLDVSIQARIIELILELREKLGIAFLFVSHDLAVVQQLADTVGVMYLGKIIEHASTAQLFDRPAHPYTRSLLNAVPVADPGHAKPVVLAGEPPSPLTPAAGCVFHSRCPDMFSPCASTEPGETIISGQDGSPGIGQDFTTADHRVRCHLWKG